MNTRTPLLLLLLLSSFPAILCSESVHILKKNETLYSIARKYEISVDELIRINNITDVHKLNVGMKIIVNSSEMQTHRVRKGETLFGIARTYDITLEDLLTANNIRRDYLLKVDDVLKIPVAASTAAMSESGKSAETTAKVSEQREPAEVEEKNTEQEMNFTDEDWPIIGVPVPTEGKLSGVYIQGNEGDPVRTISSGTVVWVGPYRGFGKVVLIQSLDRYVYVYGGNEEIAVTVGEEVSPGKIISRLGTNPHSQKPELFFSVFRNGKPVDPETAPRS